MIGGIAVVPIPTALVLQERAAAAIYAASAALTMAASGVLIRILPEYELVLAAIVFPLSSFISAIPLAVVDDRPLRGTGGRERSVSLHPLLVAVGRRHRHRRAGALRPGAPRRQCVQAVLGERRREQAQTRRDRYRQGARCRLPRNFGRGVRGPAPLRDAALRRDMPRAHVGLDRRIFNAGREHRSLCRACRPHQHRRHQFRDLPETPAEPAGAAAERSGPRLRPHSSSGDLWAPPHHIVGRTGRRIVLRCGVPGALRADHGGFLDPGDRAQARYGQGSTDGADVGGRHPRLHGRRYQDRAPSWYWRRSSSSCSPGFFLSSEAVTPLKVREHVIQDVQLQYIFTFVLLYFVVVRRPRSSSCSTTSP